MFPPFSAKYIDVSNSFLTGISILTYRSDTKLLEDIKSFKMYSTTNPPHTKQNIPNGETLTVVVMML
jgi:hypothetical protein